MQINLSHNIENDEYTEYVYSAFDIQNKALTTTQITVDFDNAPDVWNIGVILGGSGSGKTTILKQLGDVIIPNFSPTKSLISNFIWLTPEDSALLLTSMGLSSIPTWLRPYHLLSNGEQYRAALAYSVSKASDGDIILIDEYTSVVDRDVAKAMSFALQKYIRRSNKQIVLASCHYDILEWLMPDWICNPQTGGVLERCDYLRHGRPKITLQISRVEVETWDFFKKHHYLTEQVNKSCKFILFEWNDKPVGIVAISTLPSGTVKNSYRLSRTVVLPDYQGLGIGSKISEFCAAILKAEGLKCFTKTVNPALGIYRDNSTNWKKTSKHGKVLRGQNKENGSHIWDSKVRPSYCHEYVGEPILGYEELLLSIKEMRSN
jgi:ABC-type lipoprotein export system ATPase subunit/GNAT superfamily N-acetyltransferase